MPNLQHQNLRREKNTKFTTKFTWGKKTPNLQHQNLREKSWEKIYQIYNINIYMRKNTPNLQHQNLREENKNAKFTTSKFAREKKSQIYNIKIYVRKKPPNLQHQNLREKKKRQIYSMKIYVRKKTAKFTTSKFTWEKKPAKFTTSKFTWEKKTPNLQHQNLREKKKPNLKHQNLRGKKNEKFTTSLTTSRTTLDVCHNTDRGRCPNQRIIAFLMLLDQPYIPRSWIWIHVALSGRTIRPFLADHMRSCGPRCTFLLHMCTHIHNHNSH